MFLKSSLQTVNKMRTNRQHTRGGGKMFTQLKKIALQSQGTLVQDALGLSALVVMLIVALHLPTFI
ncbi:hypothetical protein CEP88_02925 [Roseobacter denitrificans]|nr:hypothetical protein CEP88_02925 [Roseobacter denitrificans]